MGSTGAASLTPHSWHQSEVVRWRCCHLKGYFNVSFLRLGQKGRMMSRLPIDKFFRCSSWINKIIQLRIFKMVRLCNYVK